MLNYFKNITPFLGYAQNFRKKFLSGCGVNYMENLPDLVRAECAKILEGVCIGTYDAGMTYLLLTRINKVEWLKSDCETAEKIIFATSIVLDISYSDILSKERDHKAVIARKVAIHLTWKILGMSQRKIAKAFNYDNHTSICYHLFKTKKIFKDFENDIVLNDDDKDFLEKYKKVAEALSKVEDWII